MVKGRRWGSGLGSSQDPVGWQLLGAAMLGEHWMALSPGWSGMNSPAVSVIQRAAGVQLVGVSACQECLGLSGGRQLSEVAPGIEAKIRDP